MQVPSLVSDWICLVVFIQCQPCIASAFPIENPLQIVHLIIVFFLKARCHLIHLSFPGETNTCVSFCLMAVTSYLAINSDAVGQTVLNVSQPKISMFSKQKISCTFCIPSRNINIHCLFWRTAFRWVFYLFSMDVVLFPLLSSRLFCMLPLGWKQYSWCNGEKLNCLICRIIVVNVTLDSALYVKSFYAFWRETPKNN